MKINAAELGKNIISEVLNDPAPGFYPGGFKPPHKGHFEVAKDAASKNFITNLTVIIGRGIRDGITADQSKAIWDIYLKAEPNQKIDVKIADKTSPIADIFDYLGKDVENKAYVIGGRAETQDQNYFTTLENKFGDRVRAVAIDEKFVDSKGKRVSASDIRTTMAILKTQAGTIENTQKGTPDYNKAVSDYNNTYDYFKGLFPEAVVQKGYFNDILRILNLDIPKPESLNESVNEYKNQTTLNPNIFDGEQIKPKIREALLKIANTFWNKLDLGKKYDDITLTGSSANYNWNPKSDIDLHIVIDFNKFKDPKLARKLFDQAEANWISKYDIKIKNNPIAPYIQDSKGPHRSTGVYSVLDDKWIKKPTYEKIEISDSEIDKKANPFKKQIDLLSKSKNPDSTLKKIETLKNKIKNFRETGLDDEGEYSIENLVFKELRNSGYLEKLNNIKKDLTTKSLSKNLNENVDKNIVDNFVRFTSNYLDLENIPEIEFKEKVLANGIQPSFGGYMPNSNSIVTDPSGRHIIDILRTLAHELVHAKQNEFKPLTPEDGATGSPYENEANAVAGILMRLFAKQNPEIFQQ
jgi:hypothetical protein